jgi:rod shape-determining protein MreD
VERQAVTGTAAKLAVLLALALTLQHSLMADLRIGDVQPDLLLLVAILAGMVGGPERGALIGFVAGLLVDLFAPTPLGLSALSFSLVGFAAGGLQAGIIRSAWWIAPVTGFVGSVAGILFNAVLGAMIGRSHFVRLDVLLIALGVGAVNAVLAVPVGWALSWAMSVRAERSFAR